MKYEHWREQFLKGKKAVSEPTGERDSLITKIESFLDEQNIYWQCGFTFTKRLVLRRGELHANNQEIVWGDWATLHFVEVD